MSVFGSAFNALSDAAENSQAHLKNIVDQGVSTVQKTTEKVKKDVSRGMDLIENEANQAVGEVNKNINKVSETALIMKNKVNEKIEDTANQTMEEINNNINKISNTASTIKEQVNETIKDEVSKVKDTVTNPLDAVTKQVDSIKETAVNAVKSTEDAVDEVSQSISNDVKTSMENVGLKPNILTDKLSAASKIGENIAVAAEAIQETVTGDISKMKSVGRDVGVAAAKMNEQVGDVVKDGVNYYTESTKDLTNKLVDAEKKCVNQMANIEDCTQKCVSDKVCTVKDAGKCAAGAVCDGAVLVENKCQESVSNACESVGNVCQESCDEMKNFVREGAEEAFSFTSKLSGFAESLLGNVFITMIKDGIKFVWFSASQTAKALIEIIITSGQVLVKKFKRE